MSEANLHHIAQSAMHHIDEVDASFLREFEFIRKNSKNIFFVAHRQKMQIPIWVSAFFIIGFRRDSNPSSSAKNPECESVRDYSLFPFRYLRFSENAFVFFGR